MLRKKIIKLSFLLLPIFGFIIIIYSQSTPKDSLWVELIQKNPRRYSVGTIHTFNYSAIKVCPILTNFDEFPKIFKYCSIFHKLPIDSSYKGKDTYFAEGKGNLIRVVGYGVVDSMYVKKDSSYVYLKVTQDFSEELKKLSKKKARGWFSINVANVNMVATLTTISDSSCQVKVDAWGDPDVRIPKWVLKFALKLGFPQFIRDVELILQKRTNLNDSLYRIQ